jgi:hypothetical protein
MIAFLKKIGELFKALFALMFPMFFAGEAAARGGASAWGLRAIVGFVFLLLLWLLNISPLHLRDVIRGSAPLNEFWLPALALCVYGMLWVGWWLWRVLTMEIEPPTSEFPDIDRAWAEAMAALNQAGIRLEDTPLFLVLGWSGSPEADLLQSTGIKATVRDVPRGATEPLHVTGNSEGVWVTCPGASVLGLLAQSARETAGDALSDFDRLTDDDANMQTAGTPAGEGRTLGLNDFVAQMREAASRRTVSAGSRKSDVELEPVKKRLRRLCGLMARDRKGLCPVNGVLVTLPATCAETRGIADEIARSCQADLTTAFTAYRIRCPVLFLFGGLDRLPGFSDLIERLPASQRANRMGQRFPLIPDASPEALPEKLQNSIEWIGASLFPTMVLSRFEVETPGGEDLSDAVRANAEMFRFLTEVRRLAKPLSLLVRQALPSLPGEPILYGGCYFAGTGRDPKTEQAFGSGVVSRMIRDQDFVSWTSDRLAEDRRQHQMARNLKLGLSIYIGAVALGLLALVGMRLAGPKSKPPTS